MGVVGSPMCVREVVVQNVASGMLWEVWWCAGVPWRSPPIRTGRSGGSRVSRVASHVRVSWYVCLPCCVFVCGRYAEMARSGFPSFGVSLAMDRYGWYGVGTRMGSMVL